MMPKDLDLGIHFFLQLTVIVAACRLVGYLGVRFLGQTQVTGEMIAGVMLGPSLLGALAPHVKDYLFPAKLTLADGLVVRHPSMMILYAASQVGLSLYMFVVGMELDVNQLKKQKGSAFFVSASGILTPFVLGYLLSGVMLQDSRLFGAGVTPLAAGLFLGAAMSITAFPMLARIIYEMGLTGSPMGVLALSSGAFDDATAWCLLAIVLAFANKDSGYAVRAIGGGALYAITVLTAGRKLLTTISDRVGGTLTESSYAAVIGLVMLGSWFTDAIGIYAVFGAFIVGMAMPKNDFTKAVQKKTESLTVALFLPLFFVFSGLNTKISLVNTPYLWALALASLACAVLGKGVACTLAAKASGQDWQDALGVGILMNSRGLMELIILNIGLQQKVIQETLFTIMVIMAVVTTLMTSPLFNLLMRKRRAVSTQVAPVAG